MEGWRFAAWGEGTDVSDVAVPLVFRVEVVEASGKKPRKRR
jgi:hypothetical protein